MDQEIIGDVIARAWADEVIPSLSGLIAIPALSPSFDPAWAAAGHLRAAVDHVRSWIESRGIAARCEVLELAGRSPLLVVDAPASGEAAGPGTVLLYGHLDKQPALGQWSAGLGPWQSVLRDGPLGRRYRDADFVITGALGVDSNMHVPDEWLDIRYAEQVTAAVAHVLHAHASRR